MASAAEIQPFRESGFFFASTDAGDISWIVPTGHIGAATFVPGVSAHTWQATACSGSSIGRKGMMVAAKTIALSALDLLENPAQLGGIRAEFEQRRKGTDYKSLIPVGSKPPLNYRSE